MVAGLGKSKFAVTGMVFSLVVSLCSVAMAVSAPTVSVQAPVESVLSTPLKTVLGMNGDMYVADPRAGGVVVLDQYGVLKQVVKTAKPAAGLALVGGKLLVGQGTSIAAIDIASGNVLSLGSGQLLNVSALAVDASGYIYAADAGTHSIKKLDVSGSLVTDFGGSVIGAPVSVVVIDVVGGQQVVVVDALNGNVQFYATTGSLVKVLGAAKSGGMYGGLGPMNFGYPSGVAFEYLNGAPSRMYVVDMFQGQIQVVDAVTDQFLSFVSSYGTAFGTLLTPSDAVFDQVNKRLLVANGLSNLVSFGIDGGANPINKTAPSLTVSQDMVVSVSSITISGTVDSGCTVKAAADTLAHAGTAGFSSATSWTILVDGLVPGKNTISITAANQFGTAITKTVNVNYIQPSSLLQIDAFPALTSQALLQLTGKSEAGSSVRLENKSGSFSGDAVVSADGTWVFAMTLVEGGNNIVITASKPGSSVTQLPISISLDSCAPVIVSSLLPNNSNSAAQVLNIAGMVSDANLASFTVNGLPVMSKDGYFNTAVTLNLGSNIITIEAADTLGNKTVDVRTINFDPAMVNVVVAAPVDGSFVGASSVAVVGTLDKIADIKVNGVSAVVDRVTLSWSAMVDLTKGVNTINIVATDAFGKTVEAKRTVVYDSAAPVIGISIPAQDIATQNPSLVVSGVVADDIAVAGVFATVNGASVPVAYDNGAFTISHPVDAAAEGKYTFAVTVADKVGNYSTVQRTVIYDITPPSLTLDSLLSSAPTSLSGNVEAGSIVEVKDAVGNAAVVTISGQKWVASIPASCDVTSLSVKATDAAGNASVINVNVPLPSGDIDGDGKVTVNDAIKVIQMAVSGVYAKNDLLKADIGPLKDGKPNPNGKIDIVDGILILRKALGLVSW